MHIYRKQQQNKLICLKSDKRRHCFKRPFQMKKNKPNESVRLVCMAELKNPLINPIQAKTAVFTLTQKERKSIIPALY